MPPSNRGLGRGLDALLPDSEATAEVAVDEIRLPPEQPRRQFTEKALLELAYSIKKHGLLQPLVVSKDRDGYTLIAGERRLRASKQAGLRHVPVYVRTLEEHSRFELALLENLQRQDLNPIEEAAAFKKLLAEGNLTQEALAKRLGQSRAKIAASLRLLSLPPEIAEAVTTRKISPGHAQVLAGLDANRQRKLFEAIVRDRLTVRQAESWRPKRAAGAPSHPPTWLRQLELSLGTEVRRQGSDDRGSLVIRYHSTEQLNGLLERLLDQPPRTTGSGSSDA